ncbi:pyrroline-5-carboxylate reductase [Seongchinamella sediminis]|uniref:Pyrroline-5-carboxylate reductase n=1 Tax=Seongchinamella sediminis TaxID=2283635 RepID=A0A3L7DTN7_9GAMM|nr:pyrroline-5-carboxylate reductase [Seongchinamella sediminis]RLQ20928.1 pyrroline-5-carboxylate reductase [Seongchinamella sediminis]
MSTPTIAFIGAGNMANSIVGGLVEAGHPADHIRAADPYPESLARLQQVAPVTACDSNNAAVAGADVIILAVKPQVMAEVCTGIAASLEANALVISIAAGITINSLQSWLGETTAIVRCMPNTPALLGCGASGLFANEQVSEAQRAHAGQVLAAVGLVSWVPREKDLDAVTALSGSGPAYFFLFMEAMIAAAEAQGLERDTATQLAQQTALGAARMALESDVDLVELRRRVTSPGGTTQAAVESFEAAGLRQVVSTAMQAAADRADEMAREMG